MCQRSSTGGRENGNDAAYQRAEKTCLTEPSKGDCPRKYPLHRACAATQPLRQRRIRRRHSRRHGSGHHYPVFVPDRSRRIHFTSPSGQYRSGPGPRRHNIGVGSSARRRDLRVYDIRIWLGWDSSYHRRCIRCYMAVRICRDPDRRSNKKRQVGCPHSIRGTSLTAPRTRPNRGDEAD